MGRLMPEDVPQHGADRGHAQCRDILDALVASRPDRGDVDAVKAWIRDMDDVITTVIRADGGVAHYQPILIGVAALAVSRLAAARAPDPPQP